MHCALQPSLNIVREMVKADTSSHSLQAPSNIILILYILTGICWSHFLSSGCKGKLCIEEVQRVVPILTVHLDFRRIYGSNWKVKSLGAWSKVTWCMEVRHGQWRRGMNQYWRGQRYKWLGGWVRRKLGWVAEEMDPYMKVGGARPRESDFIHEGHICIWVKYCNFKMWTKKSYQNAPCRSAI